MALAALVWMLATNERTDSAGITTPGLLPGQNTGTKNSGVITVLPGQYYSPSTGLTDRYGNRVAM